jgi:nucleoside-diphosphate-sugar epimerase
MKVLLTGATGYIGSQLTKRLVAEGYEVACLLRKDSKTDQIATVIQKITVHVCDGSYSKLVRFMAVYRPDLVIHLASNFRVQHKSEDVFGLVESNLNFPTQLLEAMQNNGIKNFINTGTSWQHYSNEEYNPVNLYAATKQAFEAIIAYYVEAHGFKSITLKLFDVYGPQDPRPKLFNLLRRSIRTGEMLKMSLGEQLLDLVYIDDVVDSFIMAIGRISNETKTEIYAVSGQRRVKLRELVQIYSETLGQQLNVEWGGLPYRVREVMEPWSDHKLLPGWHPKVTLAEGIARMEAIPLADIQNKTKALEINDANRTNNQKKKCN